MQQRLGHLCVCAEGVQMTVTGSTDAFQQGTAEVIMHSVALFIQVHCAMVPLGAGWSLGCNGCFATGEGNACDAA